MLEASNETVYIIRNCKCLDGYQPKILYSVHSSFFVQGPAVTIKLLYVSPRALFNRLSHVIRVFVIRGFALLRSVIG